MSEQEEKQAPIVPMFVILEAGLARVTDKITKKHKKVKFSEEEMEVLFKELIEGVKEGVGIVGHGLHTLSPQEDDLLHRFRLACNEYPNGFKVNFEPQNVSKNIVGPDGKPADKEKKLITLK